MDFLNTLLAYLAVTQIFTLTNCQNINSAKKEGDTCILSKGPGKKYNTGICIQIKKCKVMLEAVRKQKTRPINCSFTKINGMDEPIVCCPLSSQIAEQECKSKVVNRIQMMILGGSDTTRGEFPHMVAIGNVGINAKFVKDINWFCGGSIVSNRFVVTASHCIFPYKSELGSLRLKVAGYDLNHIKMKNDEEFDYRVERIIIHPQYKSQRAYNDICLLKTSSEIKFNDWVYPVCLQTKNAVPADLIVTGWGFRKDNELGVAENEPRILQKGTVNLIPGKECRNAYAAPQFRSISRTNLPNGILPNIICALDKKHSAQKLVDTCSGDSGGPIQYRPDPANKYYYIVGITSMGSICGDITPSVYTNIMKYVDWITLHVWL